MASSSSSVPVMDTSTTTKSLRLISHQSFFLAVRSSNLDMIKQLLEECNDQDNPLMGLTNDNGETSIYVAADNNLEDVFKYLIRFCDIRIVSIRSKLDLNAFHVAAKRGHLGIVKELLNLWPELCNICDKSNTSPLYTAAVQDHLDVVNAILDADESCMRIVRKNGKTALHNTARYGYFRIVKALLDRDPEVVSIKDKKGQTALHMAVKGQDPSVVEELLIADLSILNARDKKGNTAVHMATRKCRPQIVCLLLSYLAVEVNAINNQKETAMDLAEKLQYGESALEIKEALTEAGAKHARNVGRVDENQELKRTVSDIKHEVHMQLIQNGKTNKRVSGIAKELRKLHREAVQNTTNSVTVAAVLFASIAFMAIFNLPGQYFQVGPDAGEANIADNLGFRLFCLLNATSLFISLAVVVVQITLVAWDTRAQKQVVSVVNKLMWAACVSTCGAFISLSFVVVGRRGSWMAITITVVGVPILVGTLAAMCYCVFQQHFGMSGDDSQRRIKRASGSKSFSWTRYSDFSDPDAYNSEHEKIYAL
ncbi:ankyrin repeat-containing protein At2g01680-like [Papaver somniferum]|nr:ankyrin repeat-containing protein At2g01680-like [Papaver somniferum]